MKRAAIYVRVSTQEQKQHGLSVDSQIKALTDYCKENGCHIAGIYNDAGISARKKYTKRPALLRLMDDCKAGKVDIILFTKLDRWFRSVADYYEVQTVLDSCKVPWRAIWEDYETETSSGIFKVNIMLSVAQSEADRTSERIKAVNDYRRAKGDFVGGIAPLGYRVQKSDLLIDENTRDGVKAFFDTYILTLSPSRAIEKAAEHNLSISRPKALRMLKSETYAGNSNGYKCEPYISWEDHNKIMSSLSTRKIDKTPSSRIYYFSGILRCQECGGTMASHYNSCVTRGKKYYYKVYRCSRHEQKRGCTCSKVIFESTLENFLLRDLDDIIANIKVPADVAATEKNTRNEISKLENKLKRVGIRFEDGDISPEEYREKRDAIKMSIEKLKDQRTVDIPDLPASWKETYAILDDEHKKSFWGKILKYATFDPDTKGFKLVFQ